MKNLVKAVHKVMEAVPTIEKNSEIGKGSYAYKGVKDSELKLKINKAMRENGLIILPTQIEEDVVFDQVKTNQGKNQVFTKVKVRYKLIHESGESVDLMGYGHSTDSGDKGAGKATTYAMKYALLYSFVIATGEIDDSDETHSEEIKQPPRPQPKAKPQPKTNGNKQKVEVGSDKWNELIMYTMKSPDNYSKLQTKYEFTEEQSEILDKISKGETPF